MTVNAVERRDTESHRETDFLALNWHTPGRTARRGAEQPEAHGPSKTAALGYPRNRRSRCHSSAASLGRSATLGKVASSRPSYW